ncbi:MAG: NAD(P)-binding domain-containing protein [Rhizomicrobium sp.]
MSGRCDIAIIGAGPYGLSLAAHLGAAGIDARIFGRPLGTWREHMPKDMMLKSDGFASNLSGPDEASTFKVWCAANKVAYASQGLPIPLDNFLAYGTAFQKRYVPGLEEVDVTHVEGGASGFTLKLANGESAGAKFVVVAAGISHFADMPTVLAHLPKHAVSHSYDHRDGARFAGKDVAIVGAGASAIDLAAHLTDCGAAVRIVARAPTIAYNSVPDPDAETLLHRIQWPASGIGRGWRSYFCANAPLLFYRLPEALRTRGVASHSHPAAGWFMREKIEGRVGMLLGRTLANAQEKGGKVALTLIDSAGRFETLACDHVIAATGYRTDTRRLAFLAPQLRARIASERNTPLVSDMFETPVAGLYVTGPAVIDSFGPLMRFMVGTEFAAPRLSQHLVRKLGARAQRKAA